MFYLRCWCMFGWKNSHDYVYWLLNMLDDDEKENGMILLYEFDCWSLVMLSLHLIEIFIIIE